MSQITSKSEPAKKPATSMALKAFAWLWSVSMALTAIGLAAVGSIVPALALGISAFLAAPPSWRVLARYGIRATRSVQVVAVVGTYAVGALISAVTAPHPFGVPGTEKQGSATKIAPPVAAVEGPSTCEGIKAAPKDFAVLEGAPLHERADAQSGQVSIPFGVNQDMKPVSVDTTMPVRELCRSGKWSFVSILQLPSDIGNGKGWMPTAKLRPVETDKGGRRIYKAADFEWPAGSKPYQKSVVTVVNRIMAQNPRCDAFGSQALVFDKDRAGALFKVSCFGEKEQIVDFRPDDTTNGRSFAPVDPLDETTAREACWNAAKERATHPSTVDVSTFGGQFQSDESGSASYRTTFTAKNSFNLTLNYTILCSFKGSKFTGVDIQETAE